MENQYSQLNAKGVTYYLNSKNVVLRGGQNVTIYYFTRNVRPEGCAMPEGFKVVENQRNGFLCLARVR